MDAGTLSHPRDWLRQASADAEDGVLWLARWHAEQAPGPVELDRTLRTELLPALRPLGPVAREHYLKPISKLYGVGVGVLRKLLEADDEAAPAAQGSTESSQPPPSDGGDLEKLREGDIVLTPRGTCIVKYTRDGLKYPHLIYTGQIRLERRVQLTGEGEVLLGAIHCPARGRAEPMRLPSSAFNGQKEFKEAQQTIDHALLATNYDLQQWQRWLSFQDVRKIRGERVMGIHKVKGGWAAVLTDRTILPDGSESEDLVHYEEDSSGFAWNVADAPRPTEEELKRFAVHFLEFAALGKAAALMGWLGFLPFKARMSALVTKQAPFVWLWGEPGAGKSTILSEVVIRFYSDGQTQIYLAKQFRPFTAVLTPSLSNLVPLCIDDFKPSTMDPESIKRVSDIIQSSYDQVAAARGRKNMTQRLYVPTAPLVIGGEDVTPITSAEERMLELFLMKQEQEAHAADFGELTRLPLGAIGLDYVRWSLGVPDEELVGRYRSMLEGSDVRLKKGRIRHNVTCARLGLRMLADYLSARGAPVPAGYLEEHERALEDLQIRTRFPNASTGKNPSIIDKMLQYMAAAVMNGILSPGFDFVLRDGEDGEPPRVLCLALSKLMPRFREWAKKTDWEGERLSEKGMRQQMRGEPYFVKPRAEGKTTEGTWLPLLGMTVKCVKLDYGKMLSLGLDVEGFAKSGRRDKDAASPPPPEDGGP